jgi:DNA-binding IclR family transcriptional regulator
VARLTSTLLQLGYVVEGKGGRGYEVGSQAMALGYSYLAQHDICELAQPALRRLADRFPCACSLVTREELDVVYLAQARSLSARLMINVSVGSRLKIAEIAGGWSLTAASRPEERASLMDYLRQSNPRGWTKTKTHVERAAKEIEARGFCAALDQDRSGIHAVSTPLRSKGQVYAITCAAPAALVSEDFMLTEVGPELVQARMALQQRLP